MIRNLVVLNFADLFERMSYYGVRSILILFMINTVNLEHQTASNFYGYFGAAIYIFSILAGILSDASRKPVLVAIIGNSLSTIGIFGLSLTTSEAGILGSLALIALGTGTFKPTIVSSLYRVSITHKHRFDLIYTIFIMAINIGAFLAPLLIGFFYDFSNPDTFRIAIIVAGVISVIPTILLLINYKSLLINNIIYDSQIYRLSDLNVTRIVICFIISIVFWLAYSLFPIYTGGNSDPIRQVIAAASGMFFMGIMCGLHLMPSFRSALKLSLGLMIAALTCFLITLIGGNPIIGMIMFSAAEALAFPIFISQIVVLSSPRHTATIVSLFMALSLFTNKITGELIEVTPDEQPPMMYVLGIVLVITAAAYLVIDSTQKRREQDMQPR